MIVTSLNMGSSICDLWPHIRTCVHTNTRLCIHTHVETLNHVAQIRLGHMIEGLQVFNYKVFSGYRVNSININAGPTEFDRWTSKDLVA